MRNMRLLRWPGRHRSERGQPVVVRIPNGPHRLAFLSPSRRSPYRATSSAASALRQARTTDDRSPS